MPLWTYTCPACGDTDDFLFRSHGEMTTSLVWCEECDRAMARQPSAPAFTVQGFAAKNQYSRREPA